MDSHTIAILTDVHGNAPALQAALADIDQEGTVERIYSLGDMIAIGPDTNQVLDSLLAREDVTMIRGNHEDAVLAVVDGKDPGSPGTERLHHCWVAEQLDPTFVPALRALPLRLVPRYAEHDLLLVHYHLSPEDRYLPVDREPSLEKLEANYQAHDVNAVCFGHHHPVHYFRSDTRLYLNPGALGCNDRPEARYALLTITAGGIAADLRAVPYDNRAFLASYHTLKVPAGDFILQLFHGNQHLAE
jgi:predicted phosphodiesterase